MSKYKNIIVNIVNTLAAGEGLDFDIMETYNAIINYCEVNKKDPRRCGFWIDTGCLFINNELITRVAPLPAREVFPEEAYYIEGLILSKQEAYNY